MIAARSVVLALSLAVSGAAAAPGHAYAPQPGDVGTIGDVPERAPDYPVALPLLAQGEAGE